MPKNETKTQPKAQDAGILTETTLAQGLKRYLPVIRGVAHTIINPDQLIRTAVICAQKNPILYKCTLDSICRAVAMLAEIGLEPGGALQHAHLVPYWNPELQGYECQPEISAYGYAELVQRSRMVRAMWWYAVFQGDAFSVQLGDEPRILHEPRNFSEDPAQLTHVYAVAVLENGEKLRMVMPREAIEKLRKKNPAVKNNRYSPWSEWYIQMALAKCLKHFCKRYLPKAKELAQAISFDDSVEAENPALAETQVPALLSANAPETRTDQVLRRVGGSIEEAKNFDPLAASKAKAQTVEAPDA